VPVANGRIPMPGSDGVESNEVLELLRTASGGDQQAMAVVFDRYRDRLHRLVQVRLDARLRGRWDPSDVIQEAYLDASRRLGEYMGRPDLPFFLWLRFLTAQKVAEIHRREFAQKRDAERDANPYLGDGSLTSSITLADAFIASQTSPSEEFAREEIRSALTRALEELDDDDREIILLRYFEQISNTESARVLGIAVNAASQRHVRALKRLRRVLQAHPGLESSLFLS
jgi:RNA polymerase sigma-70 factor (ECF subfamily)